MKRVGRRVRENRGRCPRHPTLRGAIPLQRFIVGKVPRQALWIGAAALLLGVFGAYWWGLHPRGAGFVAEIKGGPLAPDIRGTVTIRPMPGGSWVTVRVEGLPGYSPGPPPTGPL